VTTKVEKSKIETSPGVHKDTIYTITVEVDVVSKGAVEKKDGKITVPAWQPHTRESNHPGLQGHEPTNIGQAITRRPRSQKTMASGVDSRSF
jgi:hypothetical protein